MAHYQYEGLHFELPDGLSNDEAIAKIETHLGKRKAAIPGQEGEAARVAGLKQKREEEAKANPYAGLNKTLLGAGEAALSTATGLFSSVQAPVAAGIKRLAGMVPDWEKETARLMQEQTYQPRTERGQEMAQEVADFSNRYLAALGPGNLTGLSQAKGGTPLRIPAEPPMEFTGPPKPPVVAPKPIDPTLRTGEFAPGGRVINRKPTVQYDELGRPIVPKQKQPTLPGGELPGEVNLELFRKNQAEQALQERQALLDAQEAARVAEAESYVANQFPPESTTGLQLGENTPGGRVINRKPVTDSGLMGLPERPVEPPVGLSTGETRPGGAVINRSPVTDSGLMGKPVPEPVGLSTGEGLPSVRDPRRVAGDSNLMGVPDAPAPDFFGSAGANPRIRLRKNQGAIHPQVFEDLYKFGKSVIRAGDGTLLPLYHGTEKAFDKIKASTEGGALGNGVYLAVRPEYASGYADGAGGNVHQVYVDIRKPLVIDGPGDPMINALMALGETREKATKIVEKAYDEKGYITNEVRVRAMRQGYDGIVQKRNGKESEVVAFKPEQVKSAISPEKSLQKPTSLRSQRGGIDPDLLTLGIPKAIKTLADKYGERATESFEKVTEALGKRKEPLAAYLEKLPGLRGKADEFISRPKPASEVLEAAKAQADGPDLATNLQSGLSMAAKKGDSIMLDNMAQWFNWSQNRANYLIREALVPLESSFARLGKDLTNVHRTFVDEMFRGERYTPDQLREMGLSDKAIGTIESLRKNFDVFFDEQNAARQVLGKSPITRQDAYMASVFRGDYHLPVYDKTGKLRFYIQTPTRKQHQAAIAWLKKEFADNENFDFSKLKYDHATMYNPGRKFGSMPRDVMASWREIAEAMGDDPLAAEIKQAMERWVEAKGSHAFKQDLHHTKVKVNVRGFEGDQPWLTPEDNAHNWAKAQVEYMKDAARWSAAQEAINNAKQLITDPTILENQPRNVALAKAYMYNHMGLTDNLVKNLESAFMGSMGLSRETLNNFSSVLRAGVYIKTLTLSPGYWVATPIQAIWSSLGHFQMERVNGNVKVDHAKFLRNTIEAMADDRLGMGLSKFNQEALKWADDNGVIKNIVYEDDRSIGSHPVADKLQKASDWSIAVPDRFARRMVFLPFANALWESGKYATKQEAFRRAGEITDAVAVSMRPQDRPLLVQKLGQLGTMGYVFHAPILNMYNNLSIMARHAKKTGNYSPILTALGAMTFIGGVFNLPGVGELEKAFDGIKGLVAEHLPSQYTKIKDINPRLAVIKSLPDLNVLGSTGGEWLAYGGASAMLGTDMRGRFSNEIINAEDQLGSMLPATSVYGDMISSAAKAAVNPNAYTGTQLLKDMAPGGLARGMLETTSDRFKSAVQPYASQGITSFRKPSDMNEPGVYVNRNEDEIMSRRFGTTALSEAKRRELYAMSGKESMRLNAARKGVFDSMFKAIVNKTGDENTVREAVQNYIALDGNPKDIERQLERKVADLPFTRQQQQMLKAKRYEQIMNVVRRIEMEKR